MSPQPHTCDVCVYFLSASRHTLLLYLRRKKEKSNKNGISDDVILVPKHQITTLFASISSPTRLFEITDVKQVRVDPVTAVAQMKNTSNLFRGML